MTRRAGSGHHYAHSLGSSYWGREINLELIEQAIKTLILKAWTENNLAKWLRLSQPIFCQTNRLKGKESGEKPRLCATLLCIYSRELSLPLTEIGRWFTSRDHTSVLHAVKISQHCCDAQLQREVAFIRKSLAV